MFEQFHTKDIHSCGQSFILLHFRDCLRPDVTNTNISSFPWYRKENIIYNITYVLSSSNSFLLLFVNINMKASVTPIRKQPLPPIESENKWSVSNLRRESDLVEIYIETWYKLFRFVCFSCETKFTDMIDTTFVFFRHKY